MNSSAAIKSFTGEHGGTVCTSSNAKSAMTWAFTQGEKILFLPDQHLGRNTAVKDLGLSLDDCVLWNPWKPMGGLTEDEIVNAKVILWRGHCSVHGRFSKESIDDVRGRIPGVKILVHPECTHEVVTNADVVGSTEFIIRRLRPPLLEVRGRLEPSSISSPGWPKRIQIKLLSSSIRPSAIARQ